MSDAIYINGRFAAQNAPGVQRFATELSTALEVLYPRRIKILTPQNSASDSLYASPVGRRSGHFWEQFELPKFSRDGILLNFGNTAPLLSGRQIVVIHDAGVFRTPAAYSRPFRLWYKLLQNCLARSKSRIVTVSQFSRLELMDRLGLAPDRVSVISEGADHMTRLVADDQVLTRHQLRTNQFVLVVGTLAAHKNLAALNVLSEQLAERGIVLAITGAFGGSAFAGVATDRLPRFARYLGRVSDAELKALYENAACFVFPSLYEGFGLPAVEAMACGCAVVAADIPALRETCGEAAIYCNPFSHEDIAACVMHVLNNPERQRELQLAARAHVGTMTWAKAASDLGSVIETLEHSPAD